MPSARKAGQSTHQTPMVKNKSTNKWQCPYGKDCNEITRKLDPAMRKQNPSWVPPSPAPNLKSSQSPSKVPHKGKGNAGKTTVKQTKGSGVNCKTYLTYGSCPLKNKCPFKEGHGKRNGIPLGHKERQALYTKGQSKLSAQAGQSSPSASATSTPQNQAPMLQVSRARLVELLARATSGQSTSSTDRAKSELESLIASLED